MEHLTIFDIKNIKKYSRGGGVNFPILELIEHSLERVAQQLGGGRVEMKLMTTLMSVHLEAVIHHASSSMFSNVLISIENEYCFPVSRFVTARPWEELGVSPIRMSEVRCPMSRCACC